MFKFGDSKVIKSLKFTKIPLITAGISAINTTDVVKWDILLLLSKKTMKKTKTHIDFQQDKITLFRHKIYINFTSTGSYCLYPPNLVMKIKFKSNISFF